MQEVGPEAMLPFPFFLICFSYISPLELSGPVISSRDSLANLKRPRPVVF
jgi:hypothetical protein